MPDAFFDSLKKKYGIGTTPTPAAKPAASSLPILSKNTTPAKTGYQSPLDLSVQKLKAAAATTANQGFIGPQNPHDLFKMPDGNVLNRVQMETELKRQPAKPQKESLPQMIKAQFDVTDPTGFAGGVGSGVRALTNVVERAGVEAYNVGSGVNKAVHGDIAGANAELDKSRTILGTQKKPTLTNSSKPGAREFLDVAGQGAELASNLLIPSGAYNIATQAGEQTLKAAIVNLAKTQTLPGALMGVGQSLQEGQGAGDTFKNVAINSLLATVIGAGLEGKQLAKLTMNEVKSIQNKVVEDLIRKGYGREEAVQFANEGGFFGLMGDKPKVNNYQEPKVRINNYQDIPLKINNYQDPKVKINNYQEPEVKVNNYQEPKSTRFVKTADGKFAGSTKLENNPEAGFIRKPSLMDTKLGEALKPIKATDEATQEIYTKWTRAKLSAKESAQAESKKLANIPEKGGWNAVLDYEQGKPTAHSTQIQSTFDTLHDQATAAGLNVPYRERYVPQMYRDAPEKVTEAVARYLKDKGVDANVVADYLAGKDIPEEVSRTLKLNPNFIKQRVFPDYATAMKYGLTPKYTHPAQLAAAYKESLDTALANRGLVSDLVRTNKLVANPQTGFKLVDIPALQKPMYADKKLANALNGIFRDESNLSFGQSLLSMGAKTSKFMQELALSAGFPGTDVNFFSIGQLIKEMTSGKFKAVPSFIRANFDGYTAKWFEQKAPLIKKMAENGVDISTRVGNWRDAYKNMEGSIEWGKTLGKGWDKAFNKKTFSSFMSQLYVNTFESAYKTALKKGLTEEAAAKLAADTTRAYHGLFEDVARSKTVDDALSTAFFAPKFREGIINTLWNTGKSLTTELTNPAFSQNRKLATGMALTYGAYQALNYKINGHYTWDNETGREFSLRIPYGDGQVMYVEFMPSFLSLPRNLIGAGIAAKNLDPETFKQKAGSILSMPLQTAQELWNNKDYFGNDIVGANDSREEKIKKWADYLLLQKTHPYVKLVSDLVDPFDKNKGKEDFKKPLMQSLVEAAEFPLKFNSMDRISRQQFYEAADKRAKETAKQKDRIQPIYDQAQKLLQEGKDTEADQLVNDLSDADYEIYKKIKSSAKTTDTNQNKSKLYQDFLHIQDLKTQGNEAEAQRLVDQMSDDDYHAYTLLKKQFSPE